MGDGKVSEYPQKGVLSPTDELYVINNDGLPTSSRYLPSALAISYIRSPAEIAAGVTPTDYRRDPGDVRRYGAALDNITDDSPAFLSAGRTGLIFVPNTGGIARLATAMTFTSPIKIVMEPGSLIRPDILSGKLFALETNDVDVRGFYCDGTGSVGPLPNNMYILFGGNGSTKFLRHKYENIHIRNCFLSDGNTQASNLLVTHGLYIDNVDHVDINHYYADTLSGSALFMRDVVTFEIRNFRFKDCQWYNLNLDSGCDNGEIHAFEIDCQLTTGIYWGGAVNLMSLHTSTRNKGIRVHDFKIRGYMSYSVAVRVLSITQCSVYDFEISDWAAGTWALTTDMSAVRVETRGVSTSAENGPCHNLSIYDYDITAPTNTAKHRAIYFGNQWQTSRNPCTNMYVGPGIIRSTDASDYFAEGIIFHGQSGGFEGITIMEPKVTTVTQTGPVVGGAIGFVGSNAGGGCRGIKIYGGDLEDLGTPNASEDVGISIGAFTDRVFQIAPTRIDNYFYGVRTLTNAGPTLEGLDDQDFDTNTNDTLFGVALSKYNKVLTGSVTWNPGNIADGDEQTQVVNITGVALGDFVTASFSVDVADLQLTADITVSGQVTAILSNNTGSPVDLAEGTLRIRVSKAGSGE